MKEESIDIGYRVIKQGSSIFKTPKDIISTKREQNVCKYCNTKLERYHALIPVSEEMEADVPGDWCRRCDKLYVQNGISVCKLLKDNYFAKEYTLNNEALWIYTDKKIRQKRKQDRLEKLSTISSSEIMICVRFADKSASEYIIVSSKKDCNDNEIVHYSSEIGRELLSAAYAKQREGSGILNGKKYQVIDCIYPHSKCGKMSEYMMPIKLNIRQDGGYISSVKNNQMELVDSLLYSLRTQRYEIIPATLDRRTGECFIDIRKFRNYVNDYGRPNLAPDFWEFISHKASNFDELNSESILKGYGYSVSKADGLSISVRRDLLMEIVDLEILTVNKVLRLLDFFIQTHSNDRYLEARCKWESDKKFIQEYRVNPQRFLIAKF